jgi:probable rRNA maturation factor
MSVEITAQSNKEFQAWESNVIAACKVVLDQLRMDEALLTVVLTDRATLRNLNLEFAQINHATDVLAFPINEQDPETGLAYLGDVIIALPIAQEQAQAKGHALEDELALLAIHGTLHLLGYDHADQSSKAEMWSLQEAALHALGIKIDTSYL